MEEKVVMNEQRQNVYLNIIQGLLNSRSDREVERILNTNEEFIDVSLVQKIQQVAEELVENGDDNAAEFLIGIGRKLAEAMVKSSPTIDFQKLPHPDSQLDFLIPVLQAIIYTNGNPQFVFPLLQQNLDKLDERFVPKFSSWADNAIHDIEGEQAQNFVLALVRFSELVQYFSHNIRENDIEVTIACYEIASRVLNRQSLPEQWAAIHNNLAIVYRSRLQGKRAENLENAIFYYEKALQIFTRDSFPERWATIQSNLANAYRERIYGDPAENVEFALACNEKSLQVFTYQDFQENWAITQFNLAVAYRDRLSGSQEENLQRALVGCQEALGVYNCNDHPEQWAKIQATMANINSRMGGAENLENAILGYKKALQVYQRDTFAREWAETQSLLGISYSNRLQGERAKNIEDSIVCSESALQVLTRQTFPENWAKIQNNLGVIYQNRLDGTQKENLEHSINSFQNALLVYKNNYPKFYAEALLNLGISHKKYGNFSDSYNNLSASIKGVENLREEIISGDNIKQKIAEIYHQIYQHIVEVSLNLNQPIEAIEYVERSKTRNLVELLLIKDRHTIFPSEVVVQLDRLRDEIASGQYELQNATADDPTALTQDLQQLRQQRNELQDQYLPIGSGFQFEPFQSSLSDRTAIVEFYITSDKLLVFIVTQQTQQPIVLSPDLINLDKLTNWANSYLKAYSSKKSHWQRRLTTRLHLLAKILYIDEIIKQIPTKCNRLILIPHRYLHLLPLHALPLAGNSSLFERFPEGVSYAPSCQLLQLAQTRQRPEFTHLLAIQNPTEDLAYTDIEVEALQHYFKTTNIFKKDLATREAINSASLNAAHCVHFGCHGYFNGTYPRKSALLLADAKIDSLPPESNEENYLNLQNGSIFDLSKCLTLDAIFDRNFNLECCRLVILSACETGLIDWSNTSDEYIGLPSGFIYAGAFIVISSLWTVNDLSTAFLMIRFYQNLEKGLTVTLALNQAQLWLRDITKAELKAWSAANPFPLNPTIWQNIRRRLSKLQDNQKPFQDPFYWAAFCAIGGE